MNGSKWSLIGLAISLALAGFTVVFAQSLPYAVSLITASVLLVLGMVIWSAWELVPRVFTDADRPKRMARSIYRRAAQRGGTIHATHILPRDRSSDADFAIDELRRASAHADICFHRILLLTSIADERAWLEQLFDTLPPDVAKRFYVLKMYPLTLPRVMRALLPRVNVLLYQSTGGRRYESFVGLDRLHVAGLDVNFAVHSRSASVYRVLLKYFEHIAGSGHFRSCSSLQEYQATQRTSTPVERGQVAISRIVEFAETTSGVVHVAMFGGMARATLGLSPAVANEEAEADVDLLVVVDPSVLDPSDSDLRRRFEEALGGPSVHVTWGPDLATFYPFRHPEKRIEVDIEIHQAGSDFYAANRLLGYSIFQHFMPLYSIDNQPITSVLSVPTTPLSTGERWRLVLEDRQGIQEFRRRTRSFPDSTDPRRLCTQVLRNLVWAETGMWLSTGRLAADYLLACDHWTPSAQIGEAKKLLDLPSDQIRANLSQHQKTTKGLLEWVEKHAFALESRKEGIDSQ